MPGESILYDLAVVLVAAGAAAFVCHRLGQPKVIGYVLAGLALGPHTPPFALIKDDTAIQTLADLGVIFLMFSLGLEFNFRRFRKVGPTAGITAVLDVGVMVWLGYMFGRRMGWSPVESLFLGGMLSDSSTTILAKTLQELGRSRDRFAGLAVGITVVEDVLSVGIIAVLTGLAVTGVVQTGFVAARLWILIVFIVAVAIGGLLIVPRLLNRVDRLANDELLVLSILGICFGISLIAARLQLSVALGAVLVGAIASESRASQRLSLLIDPLRHAFGAVFFVAVGLMLDPSVLFRHWAPLLVAAGLVIVGKFMMNALGLLLTGHDFPTALRVGGSMAQVGEFTFIIAALGLSLGATSAPVYQVGVGAAILTTVLSPYWIRLADRMAVSVEANPSRFRWTQYFALYNLWVERIAGAGQNSVVRKAVRRSMIIMAVNTALICAVMGAAGYLARGPLMRFPGLADRPGLLSVGMWVLAMVVCLPMYVATFGKLRALGMILAEVGLPMTLKTAWARTMRTFLANAILSAGLAGQLLLTLALSSTMFPSRIVPAVLTVCAVIVALWRWRGLVRVYAQAQSAVTSMLQEPERAPAAVAGSAAELTVETAVIDAGAGVLGKRLRSIRIRDRTGATLVGIGRSGGTITNPGPREELLPGDKVFMLGNPEQIRACRALLRAGAGPAASASSHSTT